MAKHGNICSTEMTENKDEDNGGNGKVLVQSPVLVLSNLKEKLFNFIF